MTKVMPVYMPTVKNPNKIEVYKVKSKSLHLRYYPILHPEVNSSQQSHCEDSLAHFHSDFVGVCVQQICTHTCK